MQLFLSRSASVLIHFLVSSLLCVFCARVPFHVFPFPLLHYMSTPPHHISISTVVITSPVSCYLVITCIIKPACFSSCALPSCLHVSCTFQRLSPACPLPVPNSRPMSSRPASVLLPALPVCVQPCSSPPACLPLFVQALLQPFSFCSPAPLTDLPFLTHAWFRTSPSRLHIALVAWTLTPAWTW